jgi:peptide/nickel transport system permease protein
VPDIVLKLLARATSSFLMVLGSGALIYLILRFAPGAETAIPSFSDWAIAALQGDLGESTKYRVGESVTVLIGDAATESLFVVGWAVVFSMLAAVILTWIWSGRSSPTLSPATRGLAYLLSSSPVFLLSYWAVRALNEGTLAAAKRGLIDDTDWYGASVSFTSIKYWFAALVLAVGNGMLMEAARSLNTEVQRVLQSDFILFARARGRAIWRHLVLSLIAPIASSIINRLTAIFGGAIIVEYIFGIPGLGRLTWDAAAMRDSRLLLGSALVWALTYAVCHVAADILAAAIDPRLRGAPAKVAPA